MSRLRFRREAAERVVGRQAEARPRRARRRRGDRPRGSARARRARAARRRVRAASGRSASPMPATPATRPSTATNTGLRPSATHRRGERREIVGNGRPAGLDVGPVPDADVVAVEPAGDALARDLDHVLHRPHDPDRRPGRAAEGAGHGVRRLRLEVPRELERRVVALPARHRRPALGERAGLVEQHGVDAAEPLERVGVLDEDARARGAQQRDGDGERHREPERAGTGDDEQGDDALERDGRPAVEPRDAGDDGQHEQGLDEAPGQRDPSSAGGRASWRAPPGRWPAAPRRASAVAGGVDADDEPRPEVRGAGVDRVALPHGHRRRPRRSARRCRATSGPRGRRHRRGRVRRSGPRRGRPA